MEVGGVEVLVASLGAGPGEGDDADESCAPIGTPTPTQIVVALGALRSLISGLEYSDQDTIADRLAKALDAGLVDAPLRAHGRHMQCCSSMVPSAYGGGPTSWSLLRAKALAATPLIDNAFARLAITVVAVCA